MKSRQSGMTIIGFIFILLIAGFFAIMAMKLVPAYLRYYSIVKAMNQVSSEGLNGQSLNEVRRDFMYKLSFQYADDIKPDSITFPQRDGGTSLHVDYDQRIHFVYNIDFLLHFDHTVPLKGSVY
ncbi:DUF4845 domain-containing protein [Oleiagrimonas sp. C23AA]|uniref:DUF4845 domain-containing protein n=1 Tax=Oleiagrimonas sp. C23AA TaxID=2719047 RepID=UPI0014219AE7|nr:DUF4845 domain-containing protein [Oleiagrimonas sp. C23AA]NII10394.1 DUF4845 domain-containing protein [Oleiagrimonas sp. C23AA]